MVAIHILDGEHSIGIRRCAAPCIPCRHKSATGTGYPPAAKQPGFSHVEQPPCPVSSHGGRQVWVPKHGVGSVYRIVVRKSEEGVFAEDVGSRYDRAAASASQECPILVAN